MKTNGTFTQWLALLALLAAISHPLSIAHAQNYAIMDLGTLGGSESYAWAINNNGQVVGDAYTAGGLDHAFLWTNGVMIDLGTLGGTYSEAVGINDNGQVVGDATTMGDAEDHAFLYSGGVMTDLGTLGGTYSAAVGINDNGQVVGDATTMGDAADRAFLCTNSVLTDLGTLPGGTNSHANGINNNGQMVGWSDAADGHWHAVLYSGGAMIDLGTPPGGTDSYAAAINNNGQIAGSSYLTNGTWHAFLYAGGVMTVLGTLGGSSSYANYINNNGQVVGWAHTTNNERHAFLYSLGVMVDLNDLLPANSGWVLNDAEGINDSGQIAGSGTIGGQTHAFLLTPVVTPYAITEFGALGWRVSQACGINNNGQVVGWAGTFNKPNRGFLYSNGVMVDINTLITNSGWQIEDATGINDNGHICGYGYNPQNSEHAFLLKPELGVVEDLGTLWDNRDSYAYGINNNDEVVGWAVTQEQQRAFLFSGGIMSDLGTLPRPYWGYAYAYGINDSSQVVGYNLTTNWNKYHAFLYAHGLMTDMGTFGGSSSWANAINNNGQIVGWAATAGDAADHAFLYTNGVMTDLGTLPGGTNSHASGINNNGQIVGSSLTTDWDEFWGDYSGKYHAFLYDTNGVMVDLNNLIPSNGWWLEEATGINDNGQICGFGFNPSGDGRGFLLTPAVVAPTITANPVSEIVAAGQSVTLSVSASGEGLSYQWMCNGTNIVGATNATLTIASFSPANAGIYTVAVSNGAGLVGSQAATLASVDTQMFAGIVLNGPVGSNYLIQTTANLSSNWTTLTNVTLPSQSYVLIDYNTPSFPQGFYLAVPIPQFSTNLPPGYAITDLGTLGGCCAGANSINSKDQITGHSVTADGEDHAFLFSNGVMTDLGTLGGTNSGAWGINNGGQVVGSADETNGETHPFLYSGGVMADLGTLGGSFGEAEGINDNGQVIGDATTAGDAEDHAFLYSTGKMTDLGTLGGSWSYAAAIKTSGQIVGDSTTTGDAADHAFLYTNGVMVDLGTLPGGTNSYASAVNESGQIAGGADTATGDWHVMLYSGGVMSDLGTLGGHAAGAWQMNNQGQIVGDSLTAKGEDHGFLYSGGVMVDVQTLIPANSGWNQFYGATAINDSGKIVGYGSFGGPTHPFLLTPLGTPVIWTNPVSTAAGTGKPATFSVGTMSVSPGGGALSYQWALNGTDIYRATSPTLVIPSVGQANVGAYTVRVSNSAGSVTSQPATLASLDLQTFAGVVVNGPVGSRWVIQAAGGVSGPWTTLTNVTVPSSPYICIDYDSTWSSGRLYRAVMQ